MMRPIGVVLFEALVIGILNALLFVTLNQLREDINPIVVLVICGGLIHVLFEYTGANEWWCKTTYR